MSKWHLPEIEQNKINSWREVNIKWNWEIQQHINTLLISWDSLEELFFTHNKDTTVRTHIFSDQHRIGLENIVRKNPFVDPPSPMMEKASPYSYVNDVLSHPSSDKKLIQKRQVFFSSLLENADIDWFDKVVSDINTSMFTERYREKSLKKLRDLFDSLTIKDLEKYINNTTNAVHPFENEPNKILKNTQLYLGKIQWLIQIIQRDFSHIWGLFNSSLILSNILSTYNLHTCFSDILKRIKQNTSEIEIIIWWIRALEEEITKICAVIKIAKFIQDFEMKQALFDPSLPYGYENGYSPFETLEENIRSDSLDDDNSLNIFRAPNGIGKTFFIEKDFYISIFGQTLWYTSATNANLRLQNGFYYLNRMQSSSYNDDDLSALWMEWVSLDKMIEIAQSTTGDIVFCLDETGSTTDEENEFLIIKSFFEELEQIQEQTWHKITVKFSTHNQKIIDYFKNRKWKRVGFYTFDDSRNLKEWERDSDTLNSFLRLIHSIQELITVIEKETDPGWDTDSILWMDHDFPEREWKIIAQLIWKRFWELLDGKEMSFERKKKLAIVLLKRVTRKMQDYADSIETFLHEERQIYEKPTFSPLLTSISFSPETKKQISDRNKWFYGSFFYWHTSDYKEIGVFEYTSRDYQTGDPETELSKRLLGKYFHHQQIEPIPGSSFSNTKIPRHSLEPEYVNPKIWYSNTSNWSAKGIEFKIPKDWFVFSTSILREYLIQAPTTSIPIVQERQDAILEILQKWSISEEKLGTLYSFIFSIIELVENMSFIIERPTYKKNASFPKLRKINLMEYIYKEITENTWFISRWTDSTRIEILKEKKTTDFEQSYVAYRQLKDFCNLFHIRMWKLLSKDEIEFYELLWKNHITAKYDVFTKQYQIEWYSLQETRSMIQKLRKSNKTLLKALKKELPKIIKEKSCTLKQLIQRNTWFRSEARDRTFYSISTMLQYYSDTDLREEVMQELRQYNSPLLSGISNYFEEICNFILGWVVNSKKLVEYLDLYEKQWKTKRHELGMQYPREFAKSDHFTKDENPLIPNLFPQDNHYFWIHQSMLQEIWKISAIHRYAQYVNDNNLSPITFSDKREITIEWMKSWDHTDTKYVSNNLHLTEENPIEIINGFNSSGKTEYISNIISTLKQWLSTWFVNADKMQLWWVNSFAYIDRVVMWETDLSSGEQDILHWVKLFEHIEWKDFVIINVDEIFSTMDKKYSTAFAYTFVGKLLEMGKFAIIVSHNHEFVELFSELKWVVVNRFNSTVDTSWKVIHTYKKVPGAIENSAGVQVLKSIGVGKDWL